MATTNNVKFAWERGPFKLIETPLAKHPDNKDDKAIACAMQMALIHNCWVRALNTVYVTAPHVPAKEYKNFVGYAWQLYLAIKHHHDEEEDIIFPLIEKAVGAEGLMKTNVEQHHAFEVGLQSYNSYLSGLIQTKTQASFSGTKLCELIDSFRDPLQVHLEEEIDTLLELSNYPHVDIEALTKGCQDKIMAQMKFALMRDSFPIVMLNHDRTYEDGIHGMFPEIPGPVSFMVRRIAPCYNWGWWKFAACDANQMPKEVPFISDR